MTWMEEKRVSKSSQQESSVANELERSEERNNGVGGLGWAYLDKE